MVQQSPYYLWLKPDHAGYQQFAELINSLSQRFGTPRFEPHITLLSRLLGTEAQLTPLILQLTTHRTPFTVRCAGIRFTDDYFRCLFVSVKSDSALSSLYRDAKSVIPNQDDRAFQPHISLMYGDISVAEKQAIAAELGEWNSVEFRIAGVSLYSAIGGPEEWRQIREFSFGAD